MRSIGHSAWMFTVTACLLGCTAEPAMDALGGAATPVPPPAAGATQPPAAGTTMLATAGATSPLGGAGSGGGPSSPPAGAAGMPAMSGGGVGAAGAVAAGGGAGAAGPVGVAGAAGVNVPVGGSGAPAGTFALMPVGFPMAGAELTFPETANPPTNQSPEFTWTGVPPEARSLALVFRDLGNGAVKWILWDIPPAVMRVPPNISKTANPPEVPGSSQLGSLSNQGYAGPGSGARQYDFVLWALDIAELPNTAGLTTAEIRMELLPKHEVATTAPILVRNTRNMR